MGSLSSVNKPETLPPKRANFPPGCAPSKTVGSDRVNAARRGRSVKVLYSSAAVVRNSSVSINVVVFTRGPFEALGEGFVDFWEEGLDDANRGFVMFVLDVGVAVSLVASNRLVFLCPSPNLASSGRRPSSDVRI